MKCNAGRLEAWRSTWIVAGKVGRSWRNVQNCQERIWSQAGDASAPSVFRSACRKLHCKSSVLRDATHEFVYFISQFNKEEIYRRNQTHQTTLVLPPPSILHASATPRALSRQSSRFYGTKKCTVGSQLILKWRNATRLRYRTLRKYPELLWSRPAELFGWSAKNEENLHNSIYRVSMINWQLICLSMSYRRCSVDRRGLVWVRWILGIHICQRRIRERLSNATSKCLNWPDGVLGTGRLLWTCPYRPSANGRLSSAPMRPNRNPRKNMRHELQGLINYKRRLRCALTIRFARIPFRFN